MRKIKFLVLYIFACLILVSCQPNAAGAPLQQTTYFELLGIEPEAIEEAWLIYQPTGVQPEAEKKELVCYGREDRELEELLALLQQVELTLQEQLDWQILQPRYILGNTQLVLYAEGERYCLPVLDVFEKSIEKPHPISWAVWQESAVYRVNIEKLWEQKLYLGLALYLDRLAEPFLTEKEAVRIEVPSYYGDRINAASWNFDCRFDTMFEKSKWIFHGQILEADLYEGYQVQVLESYKGNWEEGYCFGYQDGTGMDFELNRYEALVNESDRALRPGHEYIFFMRQYPNAEKLVPPEGIEPVCLTDRQCGVCEIIDGRVWPIFNAKPGTSWFTGQTIEEIRQMCQ
ncbi:MAG: hypothetical protein HFE64_02740 [Lachnospiraceae bacterium]|jgi:hypothetical protein|nr:hypothetical protein [Lachnospiraceae bacterium]